MHRSPAMPRAARTISAALRLEWASRARAAARAVFPSRRTARMVVERIRAKHSLQTSFHPLPAAERGHVLQDGRRSASRTLFGSRPPENNVWRGAFLPQGRRDRPERSDDVL